MVQLADCLPSKHKLWVLSPVTPKTSMVAQTVVLARGEGRHGEQEFKVILGYNVKFEANLNYMRL